MWEVPSVFSGPYWYLPHFQTPKTPVACYIVLKKSVSTLEVFLTLQSTYCGKGKALEVEFETLGSNPGLPT